LIPESFDLPLDIEEDFFIEFVFFDIY